jgi:hypothetical protein
VQCVDETLEGGFAERSRDDLELYGYQIRTIRICKPAAVR